MTETKITLGEYILRLVSLNTAIIGSGAAGFNAADRLWQYGQKDVAMVTEGVNSGTSRNAGSDKQTYYKLSLSGADADSVSALAQVLFDGQCVDGDHALCEAALSAQCFIRLADLGVPFPKNRFGEFVGYKTDHDPSRRATSAGPYTSRMMTERLERSVRDKGITIFDSLQVIKIFTQDEAIQGFLCIDKNAPDIKNGLVLFNCSNIVLATGGPAGMYANNAYPSGHYGATGLAFEAGVKGKNLTEWQFGLASLTPRWNVSGTYMQVLPRFISTDKDGGDEREFLFNFFSEKNEMLSLVFLKGYQWPFDVRKVKNGSSIIDILVYIETEIKSRRVFMDFRKNPGNEAIDYSTLSAEAREYLENGGACFGTPIERLLHMNSPAVDFFADKGVDLSEEPLEIALCAQHNNGGLDIDLWWQTNISGLFAVGEAAASHGVYRPGGSALNAGQVGSTRAAQYIAGQPAVPPKDEKTFVESIEPRLHEIFGIIGSVTGKKDKIDTTGKTVTARMSRVGGAIRNIENLESLQSTLFSEIIDFSKTTETYGDPLHIAKAFRLRETLLSQYVFLSSMLNYINTGGKSRGSSLYTDESGELPYKQLPEIFRFTLDDRDLSSLVQTVQYAPDGCLFRWRKVRDIPQRDDFFENVWRTYRENGNVF